MADIVFNIALGRIAELYNRVDTDDPANSVITILVLAAAGIEADAVLRDKETVAALLSGATAEVTNVNYARIQLNETDLVAFAADHVNDRVDLDIPDQTFTGIAAGDGWSDVVMGYDPLGTDVNANIVPLTMHDFVVTPDGSDITIEVAAAGFYRAQQA